MNVLLPTLALLPLSLPSPQLVPPAVPPAAPVAQGYAAQASAAPAAVLVVVRPRDTAHQIAQRYGVAPTDLQLDSPQGPRRLNPARLPAGEVLRIPLPQRELGGRKAPGVRQITVRSGDTLSRVARRYALTEQELVSMNVGLSSLDKLEVGSTLNIPTQVRGLLLTIKTGEDVAEVIRRYHADPLWTARVNRFTLPTELRAGDELLLPGVFAKSFHEELLARRVRAQEQAKQARILAQYQAFLAWKAERLRLRQQQYERYQAWLQSPERLAQVKKYQQQAAYEAWQAHLAREKAQQEAEAARLADEQAARIEAERQAQMAQQVQQVSQLAQITGQDTRPQMQMAAAAERSAPDLQVQWPLDHPRLTSRFGEEDIAYHKEHFHSGQDMAAPEGTPIHAATSGVVMQSGEGAYGLNVYIQQDGNTFIYGHMSQTAVEVGQTVQAGDLIGYVGCTGMCTGPHLHFEIRVGGVPVDPMVYLPSPSTLASQ